MCAKVGSLSLYRVFSSPVLPGCFFVSFSFRNPTSSIQQQQHTIRAAVDVAAAAVEEVAQS